MSSIKIHYDGRLSNHLLIYLMGQYLAEKFDLFFNQSVWNNELIENFIINKFSGSKVFNDFETVNDNNIIEILNRNKIQTGIILNGGFFQNAEIFKYLNLIDHYKKYIVPKKLEITADLFVHVRLGDIQNIYSLPYEYYKKSIQRIKFNSGVISSDSIDDKIVKTLSQEFNLKIINQSPSYTIRYGSQCKNLVLSSGSFSFLIGLFSNNSNIYFIDNKTQKDIYGINNWDGGMFSAFIDQKNKFLYRE